MKRKDLLEEVDDDVDAFLLAEDNGEPLQHVTHFLQVNVRLKLRNRGNSHVNARRRQLTGIFFTAILDKISSE